MILTGADRLAATGWAALRGRRVGVITNQSGLLSAGLVGIVDTSTLTVIDTTTVGRSTLDLVVLPDGRRAFVASEDLDATVRVVELPGAP